MSTPSAKKNYELFRSKFPFKSETPQGRPSRRHDEYLCDNFNFYTILFIFHFAPEDNSTKRHKLFIFLTQRSAMIYFGVFSSEKSHTEKESGDVPPNSFSLYKKTMKPLKTAGFRKRKGELTNFGSNTDDRRNQKQPVGDSEDSQTDAEICTSKRNLPVG